jgi:hypothetical protein
MAEMASLISKDPEISRRVRRGFAIRCRILDEMSYFWSEFRSSADETVGLDAAFERFTTPGTEADTRRVETATTPHSRLTIYRSRKPIRDVLLRHEDGSWLALIGTPIVPFRAEAEEQRFIDEFLDAPETALRDRIGGHFAALAHDATKGRFIAATDLNNIVPLFFAKTTGGVTFSSHELPLAKAVKSELDPLGVAQFVHLGTTWDSLTRFRDLERLAPSQVITVDRDLTISRNYYWSPDHEAVWSGGLDEHVERWLPLLCDSVKQLHDSAGASGVLSDFTAGEDARIVVAACHGAGIPFRAFVGGQEDDTDVVVAKHAATRLGFELIHRVRRQIGPEEVEANALAIVSDSDGYKDIFLAFQQFATESAEPLDPSLPKFGGMPGGEAYRGSYYLRARCVRPDRRTQLDHRWFTRLKFLLDFSPGLLRFDDREFLETTYEVAAQRAREVSLFPVGTQVDHMLRIFQTCNVGLRYRNPAYYPLATPSMTQSIYQLRPHWKKAGRLTRACTELLWPELAAIRTQNGVPTIRKTLLRRHLFLPEYFATARKVVMGVRQRVLKLSAPDKITYSVDLNADVLATLLNRTQYAGWFADANAMATGYLYNDHALNALLNSAREGQATALPTLGRVLGLELSVRS